MKTTTIMKNYFGKLYVEKYKLPKPKITIVGDGIYIHGGAETSNNNGLKIFVNEYDFKQHPHLITDYLENCDDRIIHILEKEA